MQPAWSRTRRFRPAKRRPRRCGGSATAFPRPSAAKGRRPRTTFRSPVAAMPRFIAEASAAVERAFPGTVASAFGHLGDGNVHFHVRAGSRVAPGWVEAEGPAITRLVDDLVTAAGGSISAEHGIGQMKRGELERLAAPADLAAMRAIKRALDPHGPDESGQARRLSLNLREWRSPRLSDRGQQAHYATAGMTTLRTLILQIRDRQPGAGGDLRRHGRIGLRHPMIGAPGRSRTCDLMLRRHVLYPTELRARWLGLYRIRRADATALQATASSRPSNRRLPSLLPCAGSIARSGCGIRPSTLPASLRMPAIRRAEPLTSSA